MLIYMKSILEHPFYVLLTDIGNGGLKNNYSFNSDSHIKELEKYGHIQKNGNVYEITKKGTGLVQNIFDFMLYEEKGVMFT